MRVSYFHKALRKIASIYRPYDYFGLLKAYQKYKVKNLETNLQENEKLDSAPLLYYNWPKNIKKPHVGLVKSDYGFNNYWEKFERFLITNNIPYREINIKSSNFISECEQLDILVWRTPSTYVDQWEADDKITLLQDYLGKMVLPNKESLWMYEDKVREQWLFELNKLPAIKTFITYSEEEALNYIENCNYPIVSKDRTGAASMGVHLLKNKLKAKKLVHKIFSNGFNLKETYIKQKNYVLFQEFVPNKGFDLRVIMVGNSYFGYYRYPNNGDFRASGSGNVEKREIPEEVLLLAKKTRESLPKSYLLAVDFLQDSRDHQYYIIETSIFIGIDTCEQLEVNSNPGRYIEKNGKFEFEPGRFWLQELMMKELMDDWIKKNK